MLGHGLLWVLDSSNSNLVLKQNHIKRSVQIYLKSIQYLLNTGFKRSHEIAVLFYTTSPVTYIASELFSLFVLNYFRKIIKVN